MFSAYGDKRQPGRIAAGARGYVLKGSPPEDLVRAVRTVTTGKPFVDLVAVAGAPDVPGGSGCSALEREREILQLLAEGLHTESRAANRARPKP